MHQVKWKQKFGVNKDEAPPRLVVLSGAGLSVDSGLHTFRDEGGLWTPERIQKYCSYLTWKQNREEIFDFYGQLLSQYEAAKPNDGHHQLAAWQQRFGVDRVLLFTQNVDGLLSAAGAQVTELHGNIHHLHCTACGHIWAHRMDVTARCTKCDSLKGVKPHIVLFGESAPNYNVLKKAITSFRQKDILLFVGTSFEVLPLSLLPTSFQSYPHILNVNPVQLDTKELGAEMIKHKIEETASVGLASIDALISTLLSAP